MALDPRTGIEHVAVEHEALLEIPDLGRHDLTDVDARLIHLDAVLEYNRDPSYLNDLLVHRLTLEAQKAVEASKISKRELIRALGTSASQFFAQEESVPSFELTR